MLEVFGVIVLVWIVLKIIIIELSSGASQ